MTLVLTNEDAAQVLTMKDTITAQELLYGDLGRGSAVYRGRTDLFTPTTGAMDDVPSAYKLKTLVGAVPRWKVGSIRLTSDVVAFPLVNGQRRRVKVPAAAGDRLCRAGAFVRQRTGELFRFCKTACCSNSRSAINAIGAKCLARKDAEVVALFGAGGQAGPQIRGRIQGRTNPQQRTFFLNSTGCGA